MPPSQTEAPKTPSGERLRREKWGAEGASGVRYGKGCPIPIRLGGMGSVVTRELSQLGKGGAGNAFWHILKAT